MRPFPQLGGRSRIRARPAYSRTRRSLSSNVRGATVIHEFSANFHMMLEESTPGTIGGGAQDLWMAAIENHDVIPHTIRIYAVCGYSS